MVEKNGMYDKNISPVNWYVGSYLIRFIQIEEDGNDDLERRFHAWENTVIVKAFSMEEAYEKIEKIAKMDTTPYRGGPEGVPVQWVYEGITEILPIYEELEDGAEIMWRDIKPRKLKNLKAMVGDMSDFKQ